MDTSYLYRKGTEALMAKMEQNGFHPCDVSYGDGYFIFEFGVSSVIHFHVRECPEWIFAIWWSCKEDHSRIEGEFFCQWEPELDKFKPSRSSYYNTFYITLKDEELLINENGETDLYNDYMIYEALNFIHKHPLRAWGIDYCGYNYNYEEPGYFKLAWKKTKSDFFRWRKDHLNPILDRYLSNYMYNVVKPTLKDTYKLEIHDSGEWTSPRYELQCLIPDDDEQETGCYGVFDDDETEEKYKKRKKICEWIGRKIFRTWYYPEVSDCLIFWKQCDWDIEKE